MIERQIRGGNSIPRYPCAIELLPTELISPLVGMSRAPKHIDAVKPKIRVQSCRELDPDCYYMCNRSIVQTRQVAIG